MNPPRRVLVTGAGGFLGRRVVAALAARGDHVVALVRPDGSMPFRHAGIEAIAADLGSDFSGSLAAIGSVDAVIHLAQSGGWHGFPNNAGSISAVAITAASRLAEHVAQWGDARFVYLSSGGVYGASAEPIREDSPLRPAKELGFYLAAKTAGETLMGHFASHLSLAVLRPFFIYGPGQRSDFLIPRMIDSVEEGRSVRLAQGRGPNLNPIHVNDACRAVLAALDTRDTVLANLAGPDVATLAEILDWLGQSLGRTPVTETVAEAPTDYVADISIQRSMLSSPVIGLKDGLGEVVRQRNARSDR